ncbi:MAG TPA: PPC domain-containing protein [Pirellulales bacterium]|nr:PPC domain-containing protein [Pirellulales bacterium]
MQGRTAGYRRLIGIFTVGTLLALLQSASAPAADPRVGGFTPPGGSRGTELTVVLSGDRLSDLQGLLFYDQGIEVTAIDHDKKADKNRNAKITLKIAPDCRLGLHPVRARTATGISDLALFSVGALTEMEEKEPNDTPETAQKIDLGTTVNGSVRNEELDIFAVEVRKGQHLTAEIEGLRLGRALFDPFVAILDRNQRELASSDDAPLLYADAFASIVAPADGTYYVVVHESTFNTSGSYRLHIGSYPRPRAVYPLGGKLGDKMKLRLIGDVGGDSNYEVTLPKQPVARFAIFPQNDQGIAPSGHPFRLSEFGNVLETEPNDDAAKATPFTAPQAVNGILNKPGDVDCFKFKAKKGQQFDVSVFARSQRSPVDSVLSVRNSKGSAIAGSDDVGNSPDSSLRLNVPADDEYTVVVKDMLDRGGDDFVYRVEISEVKPSVVMGLPELRRYTDVVAVVPKGNSMAVVMNASRKDCNGDIQLDLENLPAGVTATVPVMPGNQSTVPVLLTAKADAPLGGSLTDTVAHLKFKRGNDELAVAGHLNQLSWLIRGQNNQLMYGWNEQRMATVVTSEAPFRLEIVEPRVPLVRNGSMELKVRAIRAKDFKAPITMNMAFNPPGVGSSGTVTIAEGENEGSMPLTANKDAELGDWNITIIGTIATDNGPVQAASPFATLKVAESFFTLTPKPASVEQDKSGEIVIDIEQNTPFPGKAKLELIALPVEATAEPVEFGSDAEQVKIKVKATKKTPAARHKAIMARVVVMIDGEPVTHMLGPIELRVDTPIVKKSSDKKAEAKPAAADKKK